MRGWYTDLKCISTLVKIRNTVSNGNVLRVLRLPGKTRQGIVIPRIVGWVLVDRRIRIKRRRGILVWKQINVRQRITHHISLKKQLSLDNFIFTLIINSHREKDDLLLPSTWRDCTVREFCVPIGQGSPLAHGSRWLAAHNLRTSFLNFQDKWRPPQRTYTLKWTIETFMF
jgi:hypothetical protein